MRNTGEYSEGMTIAQTLTKAQATGNDFLMFADDHGAYDPQPKEIAHVCNRHFGIGADGVIRVTHPEYVADLTDAQREELAKAQCAQTPRSGLRRCPAPPPAARSDRGCRAPAAR